MSVRPVRPASAGAGPGTIPGGSAAPRSSTRPAGALARLTARRTYRGALVMTVVSAGMSAIVVTSYGAVVAGSPGGAATLEVLASSPAIRILFGEPVALNDPGGFTVWRTGTALGVLLGVWSLLAATRLLRGEEDAGRWALLLSGRLRRGSAVAVVVGVLVGAVLAAGLAVAVAMIVAGAAAGSSLLYATALALGAVAFLGVGAVAAQLAGSRGAASGGATGVLLAMVLVRMIGDGVDGLGWLRWLSPFGLMALAAPFHADRVAPVLVLAAVATATLAVVPLLAERRDVGTGLVTRTGTRRSRFVLLGSTSAFAVRSSMRPLAGWLTCVGGYALLIGSLMVSLTGFLQRNPVLGRMAAQAGFADLGTAEGFAGTMFALFPVPIGVFAAVRVAALARDETDGRSGLLLAAPVSRTGLLAGHTAVAAAGVIVLTAGAGFAMWSGATAVGATFAFGDAVAGAANTLPVSLLGVGFAVLGLGRSPRAVVPLGVLPGAGGFLWTVLADSVHAPGWVGQVSPFAHLEPVPAASPAPVEAAVMVAVALAAAVVGGAAYRRRDLRVG